MVPPGNEDIFGRQLAGGHLFLVTAYIQTVTYFEGLFDGESLVGNDTWFAKGCIGAGNILL